MSTPSKRRKAEGAFTSSSESELSDLEESFDTPAIAASPAEDDDEEVEEEEDEEEDDDELASESSSTPEEPEDSYVLEEEPDLEDEDEDDDEDEDELLTAPTKPKAPASRKGPSNHNNKKKSKVGGTRPRGVSAGPARTVSTRRTQVGSAGTARSYSAQKSVTSAPAAPPVAAAAAAVAAPTIKLKIGKDRLRDATAAWTPPPGTTNTASASEAPTPLPVVSKAMRGRKVVQEESDEEEEVEEDEMDVDAEGEDEDMDVDAEGEEEEEELVDEDAEGETDDEMMDSDEGTPGTDMSVSGTLNMSRLTSRQRSKMGQVTSALSELPHSMAKADASKEIPLSAQEQELKRAEMARRRRNLTEQKLQEEKMETINKLLKKQTPKMRKGRATGDATPAGTMDADGLRGSMEPPPPPTMTRWISNKDGTRLGVPASWLAGPVGNVFQPQRETERMVTARRRLVEEV